MKKRLGIIVMAFISLTLAACGEKIDGAVAKLQTAYDSLASLVGDPSNITASFDVPVTLVGGVTAEWSSDEPGVLAFGTPAGGFVTANVNRPAKDAGDADVTISALLSLQSELSEDIVTKTWSLDLTVKENTVVEVVIDDIEDVLAIIDPAYDNAYQVTLDDMTIFARSAGEAFAYDGTGIIQLFQVPSSLAVGKVYTISGTIDWYYGIWEIKGITATEQTTATAHYPTKEVIDSVDAKIASLTPVGAYAGSTATAANGNFEPIYATVTGKVYKIPDDKSNYNTWILDDANTVGYVAGTAPAGEIPETPGNALMVYYNTSDFALIQQYDGILVTIDVVIYTYRNNNHAYAIYYVGGPTGVTATLSDEQKLSIDANSIQLPSSVAEATTLSLPTTGVNGSTIVWTSSNEAVIAPSTGVVTIPEVGVLVTMTATVTYGSLTAVVKTFSVVVGPLAVTTMADYLTKADNDVLYSEVEVLWAKADGKTFIVGDATGYGYVYSSTALTLTVGSFYGMNYTVDVYNGLYEMTKVTILPAKGTDPNLVPTATAWTSAEIPAFDALTAWSPVYVSMELFGYADGTYVNAFLPGLGSRYIQVNGSTADLAGKKFTATGFIIGRASSKITIQGAYTNAVEATDAEKLAVSVGMFSAPAANAAVTANLTLPTTVKFGTIAWTSSNEAVISNAGVVTRPAVGQPDAAVTLSYVITVGSVSSEAVVINFTVKAEEPVVVGSPLIASYDLSDQVRTPYGDGVNTKYAAGAFAPFLQSKIVSGGTEKLVSSSGETNVYTAAQSGGATGPQFNGIKLGSSSSGASFTLTFAAGTNIDKIVIGCAGWASPNTDTMTVNGVTLTPTQGGVAATVEALTFEFAASNVITISTAKRIIISSIAVYGVVAA